MKYTSAQKKKLYDALLPHIYVEGGALMINQAGQRDYRIVNFSSEKNLLIPIELLDPKRDSELDTLLNKYFAEKEPKISKEKLREYARDMAHDYGHERMPFKQTDEMRERRHHTAYTLTRSCPEEAELLYYKHQKEPDKWPIILVNDSIPSAALAGGKASGEMRPQNKSILVSKLKYKYYPFEKVPYEDRIIYEEIIHFSDLMLGQDLKGRNAVSFLSQMLLSKNRINTVLAKKSPEKNTDHLVNRNEKTAFHDALSSKKSRTLIAHCEPEKNKTIRKKRGVKSKLAASLELEKIIPDETQLKGYKKIVDAFREKNDHSGVATEIMTKTYAAILACRDEVKRHQPKSDFDMDGFTKYIAYTLPKQGKAAFLYCRARDEYLNKVRREFEEGAIADPEAGSDIDPTYWRDQIHAIDEINRKLNR